MASLRPYLDKAHIYALIALELNTYPMTAAHIKAEMKISVPGGEVDRAIQELGHWGFTSEDHQYPEVAYLITPNGVDYLDKL